MQKVIKSRAFVCCISDVDHFAYGQ